MNVRTIILSLALVPSLVIPLGNAEALGMKLDSGGLSIYWIDVEGGGATLIVSPRGESVLVDTGLDGERDPGRIAKMALEVAGLEQIDHLIVTHFDVDHHGGAAEVAERIPVVHLSDPGGLRDQPHPSFDKYIQFRAKSEYSTLKPGDKVPLEQSEGQPPLTLLCLAVRQQFIEPSPDQPRTKPVRQAGNTYTEDKSENASSIVLLLSFGDFQFLDGADLTGLLEERLVVPVNLVGKVDVYQVNHHGLDLSNNPVLINAVEPTVTVMNNGHRKGCGDQTRAALLAQGSIEANYQLHKNLKPGANNTSDDLIANFEEAERCAGNHVELHVAPDGSSYSVEIPATGHRRIFRTR